MAEIVFPRGRVRWHRRRAIDVGTIVFSQQFPQTRDPNRIVINLRTKCAYPIKSQLLICWSLVHCCCATGGGGGDRCHHPPFEHTYATHVHRIRDGRYLGTQPAGLTQSLGCGTALLTQLETNTRGQCRPLAFGASGFCGDARFISCSATYETTKQINWQCNNRTILRMHIRCVDTLLLVAALAAGSGRSFDICVVANTLFPVFVSVCLALGEIVWWVLFRFRPESNYQFCSGSKLFFFGRQSNQWDGEKLVSVIIWTHSTQILQNNLLCGYYLIKFHLNLCNMYFNL